MVVSLAVIARRLAKASEILHSSDTADYKANREEQEMVLDFGLKRSQRGGFGNRIGVGRLIELYQQKDTAWPQGPAGLAVKRLTTALEDGSYFHVKLIQDEKGWAGQLWLRSGKGSAQTNMKCTRRSFAIPPLSS